ncbi:hypothetical protein [[Phormidium] sp. ETS-05]|nr:hypothetical protein [[Phormidium] sp. ETS-05]
MQYRVALRMQYRVALRMQYRVALRMQYRMTAFVGWAKNFVTHLTI